MVIILFASILNLALASLHLSWFRPFRFLFHWHKDGWRMYDSWKQKIEHFTHAGSSQRGTTRPCRCLSPRYAASVVNNESGQSPRVSLDAPMCPLTHSLIYQTARLRKVESDSGAQAKSSWFNITSTSIYCCIMHRKSKNCGKLLSHMLFISKGDISTDCIRRLLRVEK